MANLISGPAQASVFCCYHARSCDMGVGIAGGDRFLWFGVAVSYDECDGLAAARVNSLVPGRRR